MSNAIVDQLERARRELLDLTGRNRLLNTRLGPGRTSRLDVVDELATEVFRLLVSDGVELSFRPVPEISDLKAQISGPGPAPQNADGACDSEPATSDHGATDYGAESDPDARSVRVAECAVAETEQPTPGRTSDPRAEIPDPGSQIAYFESRAATASSPHLPQPEEPPAATGPAAQHTDRWLQTALDSEQLQSRLLRLYYDARSLEEEQGVNNLFLAVGFLEWYESPQADKPRFAPLLLIPVELNRKSATARFRLRYTEEEIATNLSLQAKLKVDFALKLPDVPDSEELTPEAYFADVERVIAEQPRWKVHRDRIVLWFFSFAKFLMFRDLDPEAWPEPQSVGSHPLVRGLLCDGFECGPPVLEDDAPLDEHLDPRDLYHVVDADSSQAAAIEEVRQTRNLVIQGPPGTGKSQTITNLIARAVKDGRTVLFVAEKLAALEVVKSRLDRIGLGDLCLELHSHKANKRSVLDDLGRTLELGKPRGQDFAAQAEQLRVQRARLNGYVRQMHEPLAPSGLAPYAVLGRLVRLQGQGIPLLDVSIPDVAQWSARTFAEKQQVLGEVVEHLRSMGNPAEHPWRGAGRDQPLLPSDQHRLAGDLRQLEPALAAVRQSAEHLAHVLGVEWKPAEAMLEDAGQIERLAQRLAAAPAMDRTLLSGDVWMKRREEIDLVLSAGRELASARRKLDGVAAPVAWESDLIETRVVLGGVGRAWWRWFSPAYWKARGRLAGVLCVPLPKSLDAQLEVLDALIVGRAARQKLADGMTYDQLGRAAFGSKWRGTESPWEDLTALAAWEADCRANVHPDYRRVAAHWKDSAEFRAAFEALAKVLKPMVERLQAVFTFLDVNVRELADETAGRLSNPSEPCESASGHGTGGTTASGAIHASPAGSRPPVAGVNAGGRIGNPSHASLTIESLAERVRLWGRSLDQLGRWTVFRRRLRDIQDQGLGALVPPILGGRCDPETLPGQLELAFCEAVLRQAFAEREELARFDGAAQNRLIESFRRLDRERIELARREVALAHYERIPSGGEFGEVGALRGEIRKKRRQWPIRRLLREGGHAVQAIKPVFMMSPISVAQFLEPGGLTFDLLLVDEASQVRPVEALGAVSRCRQMVVVGDERQLPPTQFFDRIIDEGDAGDEDDEGMAAGDVESVLDLCVARNVARRMLRWHYRSRHHSLIAVSNREFYEDRLYVVPSPERESPDKGLRFHHVADGVFDRAASRTNRLEAKLVAEAMIEHARRSPELSLGVGTFSVTQRDAILDELERLRRAQPDLEEFFSDSGQEPWFVKNLENIQGDERDVIFISVGYARDASGFLAMAFGPLSNQGGERRLNVLITRARLRCEVFSSLRADDIDLQRTQARGAAALKTFLAYAENGLLETDAPSAPDASSVRGTLGGAGLEEQVANVIRSRGYDVEREVGVAGFFIDLAVIDPRKPDRYLLGVECDGAAYHSARWARDRDRLRQEVLTGHGWRLHRIWSTEWFHSPEEQARRLLAAIEDAAEAGRISADLEATRTPEASGSQPAAPPAAQDSGEHAATDGIDRESDAGEADTSLAALSVPYQEADFAIDNGKPIPDTDPRVLARVVTRIVDIEGPIHEDEVARRVTTLWGQQRAGSRIVAAVERALQLAERDGTIAASGGFFAPAGQAASPVRSREAVTSAALRRPELLPPREIQAAVLAFIESHVSATREETTRAVARLLGFRTTSRPLAERIEAELGALLQEARLTEANGKLRVVAAVNSIEPIVDPPQVGNVF